MRNNSSSSIIITTVLATCTIIMICTYIRDYVRYIWLLCSAAFWLVRNNCTLTCDHHVLYNHYMRLSTVCLYYVSYECAVYIVLYEHVCKYHQFVCIRPLFRKPYTQCVVCVLLLNLDIHWLVCKSQWPVLCRARCSRLVFSIQRFSSYHHLLMTLLVLLVV